MAAEDKTEKPTAKKRRDARKQGDVLQSKDVVTVASIVITFTVLKMHGPNIVLRLEEFFTYCIGLISNLQGNVIVEDAETLAATYILTLFQIIALPLTVTMLTGIIATGVQTDWLVNKKAIKPSLGKLNPIKGIKNLFSLKSLVTAFKNIVKITILLSLVYLFYMERVLTFRRFYDMHPATAGAEVIGYMFTLVMQIVMAFICIAGLDYGYEWYSYEKKLKMSKQDIKDEYKQSEGDPKVKAKIKQKQFQMAQTRMMQDVKSADVIVRNPTHYAVALRYKPGLDPTPIILAMGEDNLALRIIQIGEHNQVPIIENVQVARALYAQGEVGHPIPEELYTAVANIILVLMKINKQNIQQLLKPPDQ